MTREQAISAVERVIRSEESDDILDELIFQLRLVFPEAKILDLMYWEKPERSAAEIVDEAIRRCSGIGGS